MTHFDSRPLLIYFAVKYGGDFQKIITALELKEDPPMKEVERVNRSLKCKAITLLDYDYPLKLKQTLYPPIVLFYYGDISLLDNPQTLSNSAFDRPRAAISCIILSFVSILLNP